MRLIKNEHEWRDELKDSSHDWYHTWDFHDIAKHQGEGEPHLFVYEERNNKIAIPLLLREIERDKFDFTSVYGYPGFIIYNKYSYLLIEKFLANLKEWCFANKVISLFSRLNNIICNIQSIESCGETVCIDLNCSLEEQWGFYRRDHRSRINKLRREGYICSWDNSKNSLKTFVTIYNETMTSLGASNYYYFDLSYYKALLDAKDFNVRIYNCYKDSMIICSGWFVFCGDIVQYHLGGTLNDYKKTAPSRLMIDTVRIDATNEGYKKLHLGGGLGGKRDGIFDFKYGFSKKSIDFKVLKIITNIDEYLRLAKLSFAELNSFDDSYFPLYRKNT